MLSLGRQGVHCVVLFMENLYAGFGERKSDSALHDFIMVSIGFLMLNS